MPDELDQIPETPTGAPEGEVDTTATETADLGAEQAVDQHQTQPVSRLDDVPEEYRGLVEKKLKDLEAGYTPKYQTLAEEKRQFEAEKQQFYNLAQQLTTQQQANGATDTPDWNNINWNEVQELSPEVHFVADRTYRMEQKLAQMEQLLMGKVMPTVQETTTEKQLAELKGKYGDFDRDALLAASKEHPEIPLKYLAADMFSDKLAEAAAQKAYQNVEAKRKANSPNPSNAKTVTKPDTKNWGVRDFFKHAQETGGELL